jgi:predicted nucleotidyltransferase
MDRKETLNKLSEYIKILNESGLKIEKAFLFGSAARNEAREESDIDVMLVSSRFDDQSDDLVFGLIWKLTRKVDSRIEPYAVGLSRFDSDEVSPLLQIVKKEGIFPVDTLFTLLRNAKRVFPYPSLKAFTPPLPRS